MGLIKNIFFNRNAILVLAVFAGLIFGDYAPLIKDYNIYIIGLTMTFSMTGLNLLLLNNPKKIGKTLLMGFILNYLVFGAVLLPIAWWLMPSKELFYGFVVIVAAPPGVAIIPFSYILKGNVEYAIVALTGAFISSIVVAPVLVEIFAKNQGIRPYDLFLTMVQLVIIPMILAQILRMKAIFPLVQKVRGKIVDWGFALLIFVAVGINREVFFTKPNTLLLVVITIAVGTFGLGFVYSRIAKSLKLSSELAITQQMLTTIKSSGFSVFTALTLFGKEAAIPSAILAIVVLLYLIFLSLKTSSSKS
ncbi:MAG: hypothetical protein PHD06_12905 [Bacteroidales bacterium]|jgi:BASS family bile acid:Na+ symporter|nr:hypothetical protein [Bacteroidales bacterium]MDD4386066.1 hypothetical protein [Bacteroidales bacterium]MDY0197375.1 hypothetical protein [Tenuifilaceae bacterium]